MKTEIAKGLKPLAVKIESLHEDPKNLRVHDEASIRLLKKDLQRFGQQKNIVSLKSGKIVAGNGLYRAVKELGWKQIASLVFENEADAVAFGIADNRTAELSWFDQDLLKKALRDVSLMEGEDPEAMGYSEEEINRMLADAEGLGGDVTPEDFEPEPGAPTGGDGDMAGTELAPPPPGHDPQTPVRLVQLFYDHETQPVFLQRIQVLAEAFGTATVSDTVFEAVRRAAEVVAGTVDAPAPKTDEEGFTVV